MKARSWLPVALALCALAAHVFSARQRFTESTEGIVSAGILGDIVQNYERFGFAATGGRPLRLAWPTPEPSGWVYKSHPPALGWSIWLVTQAFGMSELTIRLLSILASSATIFLVLRAVGRAWGTTAVLTAGFVFATSVMEWRYGKMASYEPLVMFFACVALMEVTRPPAEFRRWRLFLSVLGAVTFDWNGVVAAAIAAVTGLLNSRDAGYRRRVLAVTAVAAAIGLSVTVTAFWLWGGPSGSFAEVLAAFRSARGSVGALGDALASQPGFLARLVGIPSLAFAVAGLILWFRRPGEARALRLQALGWVALAIVNVAALAARARNHEYWIIFVLPAVAIAACPAVMALLSLRRVWVGRALVAAAAAGAVTTAVLSPRVTPAGVPEPYEIGRWADDRFDRDTLLLFPAWTKTGWVWRYYANAFARPALDVDSITVSIVTPDQVPTEADEWASILRTADRFQRGEFTVRRLVVGIMTADVVPDRAAYLVSQGFSQSSDGAITFFSRTRT